MVVFTCFFERLLTYEDDILYVQLCHHMRLMQFISLSIGPGTEIKIHINLLYMSD